MDNKESKSSSSPPRNSNSKAKFSSNKEPHTRSQGSTIYTVTQNSFPAKSRKFPCRFCEGEHYPSECVSFPTLESRLNLLRSKGWCDKCLSTNHLPSHCQRSLKPCFKFRVSGHHVSLCPTPNGETTQTQPQNLNCDRSSSCSQSMEGERQLTVNVSHSKKGVALPLANLGVIVNGRSHNLITLFDAGSQTTLISRAKCTQFNLKALSFC